LIKRQTRSVELIRGAGQVARGYQKQTGKDGF